MSGGTVLGYRRPAMLGGRVNPDPDALTVRWYGTSNFELNFADRVVLLDAFYDRGPRMRGIGFRPDDVIRADAVLIGHPHYDHISDAAQVAAATGAPVAVHPLGADVLTRGGLDVSQILPVTGLGAGDVPSSRSALSRSRSGSRARSSPSVTADAGGVNPSDPAR
jgi:L-ascorbate metabolism protein UlaG (beta-lactamase superfamily)